MADSPTPDPLDEICSLCHVRMATGDCRHLLDIGYGRIGIPRKIWEELVEDRLKLQAIQAVAQSEQERRPQCPEEWILFPGVKVADDEARLAWACCGAQVLISSEGFKRCEDQDIIDYHNNATRPSVWPPTRG